MDKEKGMNGFTFSSLKLYLRPYGAIRFPTFKGSVLRGGFGAAFRRVSCTRPMDECSNCLLKSSCPYAYVFETPHLKGERKASYDPHPFIIEPPPGAKQEYLPEDELPFNLILIGKGIYLVPYFIVAFEELGRMGLGEGKGRYKLLRVDDLFLGKPIYEGQTRTFFNELHTKDFTEAAEEGRGLNPEKLSLRFITPARMKHQGELARGMDFETLLRSILRRLSWLAEIHCGERLELDYNGLLGRAREKVHTTRSRLVWQDWERYSSRQGMNLKMGGFIGSITFAGELAEFLPFIKLGEYLHIGNGTAFGLGKYVIESAGVGQESISPLPGAVG